jgi:hypothetical protein
LRKFNLKKIKAEELQPQIRLLCGIPNKTLEVIVKNIKDLERNPVRSENTFLKFKANKSFDKESNANRTSERMCYQCGSVGQVKKNCFFKHKG